ncbi:hypothetical protein GCM10014715_83820 [Streptomyces spiralis]|uniref:Uncharacterized protein n=1 Tax=Streptomyces spiralis TaxID=66376 RepID=A0A919E5S6_9ACTN|nr:hypothetical protein [Streptomyces spiralis]GHF15783.1 hypothetical protein GCM10014715_83820 [Streptomyces spiralis]
MGTPLLSDGQLTIKSLAEEADLKRNKLTHKHTGLKDLFYALVRMQNARPKVVDDLKRKNDELQHKLTACAQSTTNCVQTAGNWCGSCTSWRPRTSSCGSPPAATVSFVSCLSSTSQRADRRMPVRSTVRPRR